jgi:hypothetical protein
MLTIFVVVAIDLDAIIYMVFKKYFRYKKTASCCKAAGKTYSVIKTHEFTVCNIWTTPAGLIQGPRF